MDQRCPKCRLINPPEAERCDCGWDFVTGRQERSYLTPRQMKVAAGVAVAAAGGGVAVGLLIEFVRLLAKLNGS